MNTTERSDQPAPQRYEAPRVEAVITDDQIPREVTYAGTSPLE